MKKILIFSLLTLLTLGVMAQNNSGIFSSRENQCESINRGQGSGENPNPGGEPTPLGSGLLILAGLSAGYVCLKKNKKD